LLDGLVIGLTKIEVIHLPKVPRMADFARLGAACDSAFWPVGTFMAAHNNNIRDAASDLLEVEPLALELRNPVAGLPRWSGTMTELLARLNFVTDNRHVGDKDWPTSASALGAVLRRLSPDMRKIGIDIKHDRTGHGRTRVVTITASTKA